MNKGASTKKEKGRRTRRKERETDAKNNKRNQRYLSEKRYCNAHTVAPALRKQSPPLPEGVQSKKNAAMTINQAAKMQRGAKGKGGNTCRTRQTHRINER